MTRIALGVEYRGTRYSGFQSQTNGETIQAELETALTKLADHSVRLDFAGRTDAGVHATNQVVAFNTTAERTIDAWVKGTNTYLPNDISVHTAVTVSHEFDPRRSCLWRRYFYIFGESNRKPAFAGDMVTWVDEGLDEPVIHTQAQALLGEHDFTSFRGANCQSRSPKRCIHYINVHRFGSFVILDVIANAFLLRMVRNIAGALQAVSRGELLSIKKTLTATDRTIAPATASPNGLYLVQLMYQHQPEISRLNIPMILGPSITFEEFSSASFPNIRELITE